VLSCTAGLPVAQPCAQLMAMYAGFLQSLAVGTGIGISAWWLCPNNNVAVRASSDQLVPPQFPWSHAGFWQSFDHASIRRGYQVFTQVCATCHGLSRVAYRNLVGVCLTDDEAKAEAAKKDFPGEPDESGDPTTRPGKLFDYIPSPYANENAARYANNGALPPDLSLITKARHDGHNYLFALLTGYRPVPYGLQIREGLHYNPYFPNGAIGMAQALNEGVLEYDDKSVEPSVSQMAKDVTTFLSWAAEPEHDDRKRMGLKAVFVAAMAAIPTLYWKRHKWSVIKTRKVKFEK